MPFDPPSEVWITVLPDPDARPLSQRKGVLIALLTAAAIAALALVLLPGGGPSAPRIAPGARAAGARGVAAAYGYPPGCLTVTTARTDPAYARADFNHEQACGRYTWASVAIFHRADGAWRRMLEGPGYACPAAGIPRVVQSELAVCP